jgi:GYF domain 2
VAVEWFYLRAGQIVGPLTAAQLREHALAQKVSPTDHVRRGGDGNWVPASKVKGLFDPPPTVTPPPEPEPIPAEVVPVVASNSKLIDCPDCGKSVSRRAEQCPHCGCPIGEPKPQQVVVHPPAPQVRIFEVVFRCVVQAVRDVGYAVGRVDKHNGMIAFKTGMSLWSFGQDITLVVVDQGKTCSIDMTSRSGQVTDWGESKRIGQKIAARAQALLAAEGMPNVLQ